LKIYGHGDVRVMNGNREKWITESRPLTTKIPTLKRSVYTTKEPDWSIRVMRDRVLESIGKPGRILVDVRTPEEYHGQLWDGWKYQAEASQRGGHIPGAVNIPWDMTLKEDGTFKSVMADKNPIFNCCINVSDNLRITSLFSFRIRIRLIFYYEI